MDGRNKYGHDAGESAFRDPRDTPVLKKAIMLGHRGAMMSDEQQEAGSGEDRLIARYFRPLAKHPGAFALADDAAVIAPPAGCEIVLKSDGIIGGVHFFADDPPTPSAEKHCG